MDKTAIIQFHGNKIMTIQAPDCVRVVMKHITEGIGLQWEAQLKRIKRHPVLSQGMSIMDIPYKNGIQKAVTLPIDMINGWLFGVEVNKAKPELRKTLIQYQKECFKALSDYWNKGQATRSKDWTKERTIAAKEYNIMTDILVMARQVQGKDTKKHHFANEARLINWVAKGEFKGLDRDQLTKEELKIISMLETKNIFLLARGMDYQERKQELQNYYTELTTKSITSQKGLKHAA